MRLLLHCCCGPCTTSVADAFRARGDAVAGWFYNPNLAPQEEWRRRRDTFAQAAQALSLAALPVGEEPRFGDLLLALARGRGKRCLACYRMRLEQTARAAAAGGYEGFSTTLLVSPYQDLEALARVGQEVGAQWGVEFHFVDLRPRYAESRARARELGLYQQNYCGCLFSRLERAVRRSERALAKRSANLRARAGGK